jgi:hypothetical protein
MRAWQRELILQRICELSDAKLKAFSGKMFHGTPPEIRKLIGDAIRAFEDDDLLKADALCERAEIAIMEGRIDGRP